MDVCFRTFPPRDVTLALLGLDNSGKSTLLANLTGGTLSNNNNNIWSQLINYDTFVHLFCLLVSIHKITIIVIDIEQSFIKHSCCYT